MEISQLVYSEAALNIIDNGTWVGDLPGLDGVRLKVCGIQSEEVQKAIQAKQVKVRSELGGEPLANEHHDQITKEVFYEVILKDWDGFTHDGEPLPYSKELAKEWITSRRGKKFFNVVAYATEQIEKKAEDFAKALEKN